FQAEDGIRDKLVTGVQTCALPISPIMFPRLDVALAGTSERAIAYYPFCCVRTGSVSPFLPSSMTCRLHQSFLVSVVFDRVTPQRSEERRVGKECRSWWSV